MAIFFDKYIIEDKLTRGGFRVITTIAGLGDVLPDVKREGMLALVLEDSIIYKLESDLVTWTPFIMGSNNGMLNVLDGGTPDSIYGLDQQIDCGSPSSGSNGTYDGGTP